MQEKHLGFKLLTLDRLKFNQNKLKTLSQSLRRFYLKNFRKYIFIKELFERTEMYYPFYHLHTESLYDQYVLNPNCVKRQGNSECLIGNTAVTLIVLGDKIWFPQIIRPNFVAREFSLLAHIHF